MAPTTRPDYKLNLEGLPQLNMGGTRSANGSATNSPIEPAGSGLRYPLGNGLGPTSASQLGSGRAGAGSPSKEYGSRLFPKRWVVLDIQAIASVTDKNLVLAKFKLKKASRRPCGDHRLPAAATPRLYAKLSQNRRVATASPISTQALRRLASLLPAKALRIRLAEDAQALCLHDSLQLELPMVLVARSRRLARRARRILLQAVYMDRQHRTMLSSKLLQALPIPARLCYRD